MNETVRINYLVFPNLTQLDLAGPAQVFSHVPRVEQHFVWHRIEPIPTDAGYQILPDATFATAPQADILFVPGGEGAFDMFDDEVALQFLREQAKRARYVTSVCTGSFILAAAGLLRGRRATTHWAWFDLLHHLGVIPVRERVVQDGNLITGAGVTSGIDFALTVTAEFAGADVAKGRQLTIEYAPQPPFDAGGPDRPAADPDQVATAKAHMAKKWGPAVLLAAARLPHASKIGASALPRVADPGLPAPAESDPLAAPDTALCRAVLNLASSTESPPIFHHSMRSYFFARLLLDNEGTAEDVDPELLFTACVLHDIGLSPAGNRENRFEIDGADVAAEFLTALQLPTRDITAVWDAIALHSSPGLAERRSPLCRCTQAGVFMDFGWNTHCVTDHQATRIHQAYPRLHLGAEIADIVVDQAHNRPSKAPRYSLADTLVQERSGPTGLTRMEQDEPHSRWAATTT